MVGVSEEGGGGENMGDAGDDVVYRGKLMFTGCLGNASGCLVGCQWLFSGCQ